MKKINKIFSILLCVAAVVFALVGCSDAGAPAHDTSSPKYEISVDTVTEKLDDFMNGRADRTSYTDNEKKAAEYLRSTLIDYGYIDLVTDDEEAVVENDDDPETIVVEEKVDKYAMVREFTVKDANTGSQLKSQNVVAVYAPPNLPENYKNVIIGAHYDNRFSAYNDTATATRSSGALSNGTGVAALLSIAEYLQVKKPQLGFTVTIVFFGASSVDNTGVAQYYNNQMTAKEKTDTVLMIELQRLGVDHVYAYCDSRETKREPFFDRVAKANGLDIYKVTQKTPAMPATSLDGIPYFQWSMYGKFSVFFNHNIPTLNLVGANWETIDLTDTESANNDNIEFTTGDTLNNLKKLYPDYGEKIASAATLVVKSLTDKEFLSTMENDRAHFPDTDVLTKNWIWYLIVLGVVLIAGLIMSLVNSRLAKKYPIIAPPPRKMKMAVFGMDYEDKKDDEIYIDIRTPQSGDNIFPEVPNNEPIADFDPFAPMPDMTSQKQESDDPFDNNTDDPFDNSGDNDKQDK